MFKTVKQARTAVSMLNPGEVRRRASRPVHIGLVASAPAGYAELQRFLVPLGTDAGKLIHRADDPGAPPEVDVVLYERGLGRTYGTYTLDPRDAGGTLSEIVDDHEDLGLALARQFPAFRRPVVERIVHAVALENALFAIATALPNVAPSLLELPWAIGEFASDTAFVTANQVRMAFLIAAACGKPIGFQRQVGEVVMIVAGAFGWRALARELAGKIPLGAGLIPKGAIAYAGTYAVGKGLEYYHQTDVRHSPEESEQAFQQGLEAWKKRA